MHRSDSCRKARDSPAQREPSRRAPERADEILAVIEQEAGRLVDAERVAVCRSQPDELRVALTGAAETAAAVFGQLRETGRGIHPATLAKGGLPAALRARSRGSAIPVALEVAVSGRFAGTTVLVSLPLD